MIRWMTAWMLVAAFAWAPALASNNPERPRARDAGVVVGTLSPGPLNAIVDGRWATPPWTRATAASAPA